MPVQNDFILKVILKFFILIKKIYNSKFLIQVQNGTEKNISKKMRKQAHKAQNLLSNIAQTHSPGIAKTSEITPDENRVLLCVAALRCLQKILLFAGHMLKSGTVNVNTR